MQEQLEQVKEFMIASNHEINEAPTLSSSQEKALFRYELIREENEELKQAIEEGDLLGIADALIDLQYVLSGAILHFGMADIAIPLFNEVQRSNMSKFCTSEEEAIETVRVYRENEKKGIEYDYKEHEGKWLIYRVSDGKTLKSINYSPADLLPILHS